LSGQPTIGIIAKNLTSGARSLHSYLSDEALSLRKTRKTVAFIS